MTPTPGEGHRARARSVLGLVCSAALLGSCAASPDSAEQLAGRIECQSFESTPAPRFATEAGTCTSFFDERVTVLYFAGNDARDKFLADEGEPGGAYLVGDHFVVDGPVRTLAEMRLVVDAELRP